MSDCVLASETLESANTVDCPTRVIIHADVDAFECQVYQRLRPDLKGKPIVVSNSTGRITSVNYEAKNFGVRRDHRVHEARNLCHPLMVLPVPDHPRWGKRDNVTARYASWDILDDGVLPYTQSQGVPVTVNFASCDEFYIDVTELVNKRMEEGLPQSKDLGSNAILEGSEKYSIGGINGDGELGSRIDKFRKEDSKENLDEARLVHGAIIAGEIMRNIWTETKFRVSAGIGHNKLLAKLGTALHKPAGCTILTIEGLQRLADNIKIEDVPGCGNKIGQCLKETLKLKSLADLQKASLSEIEGCLGESSQEFAQKIKGRSYGIDLDPVLEKVRKDAINCSKSFNNQLKTFDDCTERLVFLFEELMERIQEEKYRFPRVPVSLKVQVELTENKKERNSSSTFDFDWYVVKDRELLGMVVKSFCETANKLELIPEPTELKFKKISRITITAKYVKSDPTVFSP